MKKHSIFNIASLLPFLVIAFYVQDRILQLLLVLFFCASAYHHIVLNSFSFAIDCISQACLIVYLIYHTNKNVYAICGIIALLFLLLIKNKKYDWKTTAYCAWIMGIMYMVLHVCIHETLSAYAWISIILIVFLFLIGNLFSGAYIYVWPMMHLCGAFIILFYYIDAPTHL